MRVRLSNTKYFVYSVESPQDTYPLGAFRVTVPSLITGLACSLVPSTHCAGSHSGTHPIRFVVQTQDRRGGWDRRRRRASTHPRIPRYITCSCRLRQPRTAVAILAAMWRQDMIRAGGEGNGWRSEERLAPRYRSRGIALAPKVAAQLRSECSPKFRRPMAWRTAGNALRSDEEERDLPVTRCVKWECLQS